jgi:succinate-semialdehyde dehydrogenase / glutarate-semialdehyde dehydrogenase
MSSTIVTINPTTGTELATYQAMTQAEIDSALDAAAAAQRRWAGEDFTVRAEILRTAAALLRERDDELALLITREMGKPLAEARAEVHKCATGLQFYAEHAQRPSWPTRSMRRPRTAAGCPMNRSGWCWR